MANFSENFQNFVISNLTDLIDHTQVTLDLCVLLKKNKLIVNSEFDTLRGLVSLFKITEAATVIYTSIIKKYSEDQIALFIESLEDCQFGEAVQKLPKPPGYQPKSVRDSQKLTTHIPGTTSVEQATMPRYIRTHDLAKHFESFPSIMDNLRRFMVELGLKPGPIHQLLKRFQNNDPLYDIFCDILNDWVSSNGSKCTAQLLCEKLQSAECQDIADSILNTGGVSSDTLISSRVQTGFEPIVFT